ncbi:DUF4351 domain-containing protein [Nostoc sp. C052]|nr:DUF4351 domain-containing protein [Nostoc sp. C052]
MQILKTELNQEPIRADSVIFLQTANKILHLVSLAQLENLGEVLLDFASEADLMNWLNTIEN